jgi:hypothetical protein
MLPRLLILSLLIPAFVSSAVAQSSAEKSPLSSWFPLNGSAPTQEFHIRVPALSQNAQANQLQSPHLWEGLNAIHPTRGPFKSLNPTPFLIPNIASRIVTLAQNAAPCYTIRSYRFTRDHPNSDSTKFADYSTCQPATQFRLKDAINSHPR